MASRDELVFGLVGPIGCPIHEAGDILADTLKKVDYKPIKISLSAEMDRLLEAKAASIPAPEESELLTKIKKGNAIRSAFSNNSVLAAEAIRQIVTYRRDKAKAAGEEDDEKLGQIATVRLDEHAFIIDQLKRPEEIDLLVKTFSKRFVQVSVVTNLEKRRHSLISRLRSEQHGWTNEKCESHADFLIGIDQDERKDKRGQQITKIFHLGDVFFDGENEASLVSSSDRFVRAFFGRNNVAPTRDEFGSYMAKAASLRSVDLSRQVGAAITTKDGDIISVGCNEVPKFGGGNYWDEDTDKKRDIDMGGEANKNEVNRMVFDFLEVLKEQGILPVEKSVEEILQDESLKKAIKKSLVSKVTEYGRMVHAEMNALTDAARLGRSVNGASIYVTTYPCHNCAKNLIASGINRIVFIEPYPKSKVETLYKDIVASDSSDEPTVSIEHFFGISPRRYRDIFEKGSRQNTDGEVAQWFHGKPSPQLGNIEVGVDGAELFAIAENLYQNEPISPTKE
ncbi:anti-phage dCTP deaminase [Marivita sp. S0852]|uniref:anti-phage dCTP deaminase n=1 Tax=Marivita sp. S0852 TaxID=3373893 RepID=UPI003982BC25